MYAAQTETEKKVNLSGSISSRQLDILTSLPQDLRAPSPSSAWGQANKPGQKIEAFIEGPTFLPDGRLAVTDIPFGRILTVSPNNVWETLAEYSGEPNGMALDKNGNLVIADYRQGLLRLETKTGKISPILERHNSQSFKGLNDVIIASDGSIFFTDQGQTGLHDPTGRVYRMKDDRLDIMIDNGVSPNGLVLSPNEQVLFVAMTRDNSVWRIPLCKDGGVSKVGKFCQLFGTSGPDGLAMTLNGELLVAHASLRGIFRYAANGELLEWLEAPVGTTVTNLTFDPQDPYRLVATESSTNTVLTTRVKTPGIVRKLV